MDPTKKKKLDFEEAFRRLEIIVENLEKGEITLEESMKIFEEGIDLVKYCTKQLNEAEGKLYKLVKSDEGDFQLNQIE
jgi:exodeoxyribonuclease VII small subunit